MIDAVRASLRLTLMVAMTAVTIVGLMADQGPPQSPAAIAGNERYAGYWEGEVRRDGALRVVRLELIRDGAGLRQRAEVPDFPIASLTTQPVRVTAAGVVVSFPGVGSFPITLGDDGREISGTLAAQPAPLTLRLQRATPPPATLTRHDVTFPSGDVTIAGTLVLPLRPGPHPVVTWLSGRGSSARQETLLVHQLAAQGIASLIYDKRGSGRSTGSFATATFDQLVQDAVSAVRYLSTRADIDARRIGLHGHSAGGWVAPAAATRSTVSVAFVMTTAGPAESLYDQQRHAYHAYVRTGGFELTPDEVALSDEHISRRVRFAFTGEGRDAFLETAAKIKGTRMERFLLLSDAEDAADFDWLRRNVADPVPHLKRLRVPWLAFYGTRDYVVPPQHNAAPLERHLKEAGNPDVTVVVLPDADHSVIVPNRPGVFGRTPPEYAQTMLEWLRKRLLT